MENKGTSDYRGSSWLKGITLLIAEDDETNFRLLEAMLRSSGADIFWAKDGQEAITFIKERHATDKCVVLMDIKMPRVDGYEAKRQIKLIDEKIPVIAVTAYAQQTDRDKIMGSDFDGYVAKPINRERLLKMLSAYSL